MTEISGYTIIALVDALIGETDPYGDTYIDNERLANQQKLKDLTEHLICRLLASTRACNRVEYSMKQIGEDASDFISYLVEEYGLYNFMKEEE